ncbi:unnamed protein product [Bursaphelenchus okinawaensis]|uniref:SEC7 domain-containing protein n=1 Tax=Bursaphelenchus okinawaensis TaxID=465554 RepID=A0A811KHH7_9BILA|nr:unnamed protein product [Bursaphelenchus okinawaensis]CAG9103385.1 unnamed protein product [Bursaphelenchus okinawaensis]
MSNGYFVVYGEAGAVTTLLKLSHRDASASVSDDILRLLKSFADLRDVLTTVYDLAAMKPNAFLQPFLDVIKSQNTNDVVTSRALLSINKFINWNLIPSDELWAPSAAEAVALAVTETKFADSEYNKGDGVVFRMIDVLHSLLNAPCGRFLTNERVCNMLHCLFRVSFDVSLSQLLRMAAETALVDMTKTIFQRIPTFTYDSNHPYMKRLVVDKKKETTPTPADVKVQPVTEEEAISEAKEPQKSAEVPKEESEEGKEVHEHTESGNTNTDVSRPTPASSPGNHVVIDLGFVDCSAEIEKEKKSEKTDPTEEATENTELSEATNEAKEEQKEDEKEELLSASSSENDLSAQSFIPYGLPCARELLRFSVSLTNPLDETNQEHMIIVGLNLVTVALETSVEFIGNFNLLMPIIKDDLCKALVQLLNSTKVYVFTMANRICFLLFESLRPHLKFQMEAYFKVLMQIVGNENVKYDRKEMALESIVHLFRVSNLAGELYLNYDCGLYCSNLFEDLTKLLSENAFPTNGIIQSTHMLSLEALLTVINKICANSVPNIDSNYFRQGIIGRHTNKYPTDAFKVPSMSELIDQKKQKRLIIEGTELFNKNPKKGIEYLCEHGILKNPPRTQRNREILERESSSGQNEDCRLYLQVYRKNSEVLAAFVEAFPFENTRLDVALRMLLEAFRLPGEAAEISKIMQHFADYWFKANNEPFGHPDAAFTLAYAIIMLNTDQHNPQAQRNQKPMTVDAFRRNVSGTNAGGNFDPDMLQEIYNEIKNNEIVMPAEQTGAVKENYLWKVLMKRSESLEGAYIAARSGCNDRDLFNTVWGPATAALSYIFERSEEKSTLSKTLAGYSNCATVAAYYGMTDVFDNLIIHLCKFSTLMSTMDSRSLSAEGEYEYRKANADSQDYTVYAFGENYKAQLATKLMFDLIHKHGDHLRAGWKNVIDCLLQLFRMQILPQGLIMVEDFVDPRGVISVQRPMIKKSASKQETSLMKWLGGFYASDSGAAKTPTPAQEELKKAVISLVQDCHPEQLISSGRTLTASALDELVASLVHWSFVICGGASREDQSAQPASTESFTDLDPKSIVLNQQDEDIVVFLLELMISVVLENKYRLNQVWPIAERHFRWILSGFGRNLLVLERTAVGLMRVANKNLFRLKDDEPIAQEVLCAISMLVDLPPPALFFFSRQIAFGLHQLLHTNAANLHECEHWKLLFTLLQASGAAYYVDGEKKVDDGCRELPLSQILLQKHNPVLMWRAKNLNLNLSQNPAEFFENTTLSLIQNISRHDTEAFLKVVETLSFLIQDAVHITPFNFDSCTECLRAMVEASIDGSQAAFVPQSSVLSVGGSGAASSHTSRPSSPSSFVHTSAAEIENITVEQQQILLEQQERETKYELASRQLAALCATMISKGNKIQEQSADGSENSYAMCVLPIYSEAFRMRIIPLLQALARLTCDQRKRVRDTAFAELQAVCRSFFYHEMRLIDVEHFFAYVVFPLLRGLQTVNGPSADAMSLEELKVRAMQWAIRMVLNQLDILSSLPSFPILIIRLIMHMENYLKTAQSELPGEAIPQSLKNMIQVLDNSRLFEVQPILKEEIKKRMQLFDPDFVQEVFAPIKIPVNQVPEHPASPVNVPGSPVNAPATSPVHMTTSPVNHPGSPVNVPNSPVNVPYSMAPSGPTTSGSVSPPSVPPSHQHPIIPTSVVHPQTRSTVPTYPNMNQPGLPYPPQSSPPNVMPHMPPNVVPMPLPPHPVSSDSSHSTSL